MDSSRLTLVHFRLPGVMAAGELSSRRRPLPPAVAGHRRCRLRRCRRRRCLAAAASPPPLPSLLLLLAACRPSPTAAVSPLAAPRNPKSTHHPGRWMSRPRLMLPVPAAGPCRVWLLRVSSAAAAARCRPPPQATATTHRCPPLPPLPPLLPLPAAYYFCCLKLVSTRTGVW